MQPGAAEALDLLTGCLDIAEDRGVIEVEAQGSQEILHTAIAEAENVEEHGDRLEAVGLRRLADTAGINAVGSAAGEAFSSHHDDLLDLGVANSFVTMELVVLEEGAFATFVRAHLWRLQECRFDGWDL
jgi:hypothetical protein